jgi:hypothetical protein
MKAFFLLFLCQVSLADTALYKQIIKNKPNIDKKYAKQIAHHVNMVHIKYKIPKRVYVAILMQESSYNLKAVNKSSLDFGIAQINYKTATAFKFDIKRLTTDLRYSIEAGAIVMADFYRMYGKKDPLWFTRYHHSKPSLRKQYLKNISRWMTNDLKVSYNQYYEN